MTAHDFQFQGTQLAALPSGILWWPERRLLCVSDLHLGKSDRIARRTSNLLPPFENRETLGRLFSAVMALDALTVICLGDSFDDLSGVDALDEDDHTQLTAMMAGRRWVWIQGNHDPGPVSLGGTHLAEYKSGPLSFRHIAKPEDVGEVSGHYHPKAKITLKTSGLSRPSFLIDENRIIMPAFGAYTGGLRSTDPVLTSIMSESAIAILTGAIATPIPMPR